MASHIIFMVAALKIAQSFPEREKNINNDNNKILKLGKENSDAVTFAVGIISHAT